MADTIVNYQELRFDVRDADTTHVYVYIDAKNDAPHMLQGWHHKAFPASLTTKEIYDRLWQGDENPMMWARLAPPDVATSEAGNLARAILTWDMGMDPSQPGWAYWEGLRMLAENVIGERRDITPNGKPN